MPVNLVYLFCTPVLFAPFAWAENAANLGVQADPAAAVIKPLAEGRKFIRPPALEFLLRIDAKCDANAEIASISISIADTQKTLTAADLGEAEPIATHILIPARQVSPIAVENFCLQESPAADDKLVVRDALTAHVSLRCTSEAGESITYASHALDVMLHCDTAADIQGEPPSLIAR
jgi:hypothetical protein